MSDWKLEAAAARLTATQLRSCPARLVSSLERPGGPSPRVHRVLRKATRPDNLRIDLQEMGMLCYGAGSRPSFRSTMGNDYRALLRVVLFMLCWFDSFVVVNAVCPTLGRFRVVREDFFRGILSR